MISRSCCTLQFPISFGAYYTTYQIKNVMSDRSRDTWLSQMSNLGQQLWIFITVPVGGSWTSLAPDMKQEQDQSDLRSKICVQTGSKKALSEIKHTLMTIISTIHLKRERVCAFECLSVLRLHGCLLGIKQTNTWRNAAVCLPTRCRFDWHKLKGQLACPVHLIRRLCICPELQCTRC